MSLKIRRRLRDGYHTPSKLEVPDWVGHVRNILLVVAILIGFLVGLGLLYTWYVGTQPVELETPTDTSSKRTAMSRTPAVNLSTPVGVSSQALTSKVTPASNASITINTKPTAICQITVTYPGEAKPTTDSGLVDKKANEFGSVVWSWTVPTNVPKGVGDIYVRCELADKSGQLKTQFTVEP